MIYVTNICQLKSNRAKINPEESIKIQQSSTTLKKRTLKEIKNPTESFFSCTLQDFILATLKDCLEEYRVLFLSLKDFFGEFCAQKGYSHLPAGSLKMRSFYRFALVFRFIP